MLVFLMSLSSQSRAKYPPRNPRTIISLMGRCARHDPVGPFQTQEISRNRLLGVIVPGQIADGRMAKFFGSGGMSTGSLTPS